MERSRHLVHRVSLFAVLVLATASMGLLPALPLESARADGNEAPGNPAAFRALTAGGTHTCALLTGGAVKCWGSNSYGQLGHGNTVQAGDDANEMGVNLPSVSLGTGRTATSISAGYRHTCALLDNGTVKCWGAGGDGRLGQGDTANRGDGPGEMGDSLPAVALGTGRTATAITTGNAHTCALLDNGTVKCWGDNVYGQLGLGDTEDRGNTAGEMGDSLPAVALGAGRTATAISSSNAHTCALLDNATVKCWGSNPDGRLGLGDQGNRGDNLNEMGDNLPVVSLGTGRTATAVSAGEVHTCALLDNATVKCWGANTSGRLGLGDVIFRGDDPNEMGDYLPSVSLGTGRSATAVSAGYTHTCVRLDNASVKCWGAGGSGQLGLGNTTTRGDGANEMGDFLPQVSLGTGRTATAVTTGDLHTCARLDNGSIKCWGNNAAGQLGLGDTASRGDNAGEMGDELPAVQLGAVIQGTVTEAGSGSPVPGAFVAVLRTTDYSVAGGAVADGTGNYSAGAAPGSYYLYVIDPAGTHVAGFFGPPTTVVVPADTMAHADPAMASTRGAIAGTVTEAGSGSPIGGAWVIGINANTGATQQGVVANGSGQYSVGGLRAGSSRPVFVDPTGAHASRYFPNSVDFLGATSLVVTAGGSTAANVALPAQSTTPGAATLSGTVREAGTNATLAGVFVVALRAADFRNAGGAVTNGSGQYSLNVAAGDYKLAFVDSTGLHNMEWHDNQPNTGLATATSVTAPAVTNAALDPNTGTMAGTIDDDTSGLHVAGAWVIAIDPTGGIAAGAATNASGAYTIAGLAPGTYRATFVDPIGGRTQEYWDNSPTYAGGSPINITAGTVATINAALHHP